MATGTVADLGFLTVGSSVRVEIAGLANVRLMEPEFMVLRQFGYPYVYRGGLYGPGEVVIDVPENGDWWLAVDRDGLDPGATLVWPPVIERRVARL